MRRLAQILVIPAQAGTQLQPCHWTPACAGVTEGSNV